MPYFFSARRITCTCGAKPRDVDARLQPEALAHRRIAGAGEARRLVPRRPDVGVARLRRGEAQRVRDLAGRRPRRSARGPGRIGRPAASAEVQPAGRSALRVQVEDRARAGVPAAVGFRVGGEELVELAAVAIDDQHVAVAGGRGPPSIGASRRDRIGSGIALVGVIEGHGTRGWLPGTTT